MNHPPPETRLENYGCHRVKPSRITARSCAWLDAPQFLNDAPRKTAVVKKPLVAQSGVDPIFLEVFVHVLVRSPRGERAFQFFPASQHIRFHSAKWNLQNARCLIMR